jgi:hypothetical protein
MGEREQAAAEGETARPLPSPRIYEREGEVKGGPGSERGEREDEGILPDPRHGGVEAWPSEISAIDPPGSAA